MLKKITLTWRRLPVSHAKMVLRSHRGLKYEKTSDMPERGTTQECKARLPIIALEKSSRDPSSYCTIAIPGISIPRSHMTPSMHTTLHAPCFERLLAPAQPREAGARAAKATYPSRRADFRTSMLACASEAGSSRIPGRQPELAKVYTPTRYLTWPMVVRFMDGEGGRAVIDVFPEVPFPEGTMKPDDGVVHPYWDAGNCNLQQCFPLTWYPRVGTLELRFLKSFFGGEVAHIVDEFGSGRAPAREL